MQSREANISGLGKDSADAFCMEEEGVSPEVRHRWHQWVEALCSSDRPTREAVLASLSKHCRHQILASLPFPAADGEEAQGEDTMASPQVTDSRGIYGGTGEVGDVGGDRDGDRKEEMDLERGPPHSEAAAGVEAGLRRAELDARGRSEEPDHHQEHGPQQAGATPDTSGQATTQTSEARGDATPVVPTTVPLWHKAWRDSQRESWARVRHLWTRTLVPTFNALLPSPRKFDYGIETPLSFLRKLSYIPIYKCALLLSLIPPSHRHSLLGSIQALLGRPLRGVQDGLGWEALLESQWLA